MLDGKLQILHPRTSIKMHKLEPNFTLELNNGFPNDYAEKNFGVSKL